VKPSEVEKGNANNSYQVNGVLNCEAKSKISFMKADLVGEVDFGLRISAPENANPDGDVPSRSITSSGVTDQKGKPLFDLFFLTINRHNYNGCMS
jgi:hypothetical protein